jgi:aldehyde:ferredoxin oxidoreductase
MKEGMKVSEIQFKLLEIDLGTKKSQVIDVTEDVKKYLGGNGLGNRLIWDLVPQGENALSPNNIIHRCWTNNWTRWL